MSTSTARSADDSDHSSEVARPTDSRRDPEVLRDALQRWLAAQLPADAAPEVTHVHLPDANGMSSETILFDATWTRTRFTRLVARVAPADTTMPVFPEYDLDGQFQVMAQVRGALRRPGPGRLLVRIRSRSAGRPVLRHGPRLRAGPARRDALQLRVVGDGGGRGAARAAAASAVNVLAQLHDIDRAAGSGSRSCDCPAPVPPSPRRSPRTSGSNATTTSGRRRPARGPR